MAKPEYLGEHRGRPVVSGIAKRPVTVDHLWLDRLDLEGDGQADLRVHGGPDRAVYAYPSEHLEEWSPELPVAQRTRSASGIGGSGAMRSWRCVSPARPAFKLAMHRRRGDIGRLLRESGRCGWYLRVLERAWQLWADPWQLEAAARLLTTTALPIAQIASRRGFRSAELLRQAFVERYATRPSRHRGAAAVERRGPSGRTPG